MANRRGRRRGEPQNTEDNQLVPYQPQYYLPQVEYRVVQQNPPLNLSQEFYVEMESDSSEFWFQTATLVVNSGYFHQKLVTSDFNFRKHKGTIWRGDSRDTFGYFHRFLQSQRIYPVGTAEFLKNFPLILSLTGLASDLRAPRFFNAVVDEIHAMVTKGGKDIIKNNESLIKKIFDTDEFYISYLMELITDLVIVNLDFNDWHSFLGGSDFETNRLSKKMNLAMGECLKSGRDTYEMIKNRPSTWYHVREDLF